MLDPKERFTDRVDDYRRYRPGYPRAVLDHLQRRCGLAPQHVIADIGSGTGILSDLLLRNGNTVYGVEPNAAMRAAAERALAAFPAFRSVNGSGEATTLPDAAVDFITAATAFHWFDQAAARAEFARILRPRGWVILLWNTRRMSGDAFHAGYEELMLAFGADYAQVKSRWMSDDEMRQFFHPGEMRKLILPNTQRLDWEELRGRVLSASYAPQPGHPQHEAMMQRLRELFHAAARDGHVTMEYTLEMYCGRLAA